ncbi:hypothetical protein Q8F55_007193 [Vanrija albida]|uniref:RING-type domain-containing protein n=1 Tax=Vanrija albida TaxID=181172 RepID=A0ABR3PZ89_9TREE
MGASQSQPARPSRRRPRRGDSDTSEAEPPAAPAPAADRTLPNLRRRISTFIRGADPGPSKRERSNSVQPVRPVTKRRRVDDGDEDDDIDDGVATPGAGPGPSTMSSRYASSMASGSSTMRTPRVSDPPPRIDLPAASEPHTPSALSPTDGPTSPVTDELLSDRLRTLTTIRDTLGPDWHPPTMSPGVERLISRFRRASNAAASSSTPSSSRTPTLRDTLDPPTPPLSSSATTPTSGTSASSTHSVPRSGFSHRLSTIMGFSSGLSSATDGPVSAPDPAPAAASPTSTPAAGAATDASGSDVARIPVGAVLVIQGLAQTHANLDEEEAARRGQTLDTPSLDQQARMIGNLLTVAAAATATTLLSPESLAQQPSRSTAQTAMQTIIERLRPQRNRAAQSVEHALGDYLRTVLRDNRRFEEAVSGDAPQGANVPAEFQGFLHTLQEDLIRAVRAYAAPWVNTDATQAGGASDASPPTPPVPETAAEQLPAGYDELGRPPTPIPTMAGEATPAIPTFHRQAGQNIPQNRTLGVSGGLDGAPRRLNFFRAHLFPSLHADGSSANGSEDPDAVVPSIFVGVRSISHDPNLTTEDLVGHPSFPFIDGQVPDAGDSLSDAASNAASNAATNGTDTPAPVFERDVDPFANLTQTPATNVEVSPTARRTLRERVLERFGGSSRTRARTGVSPPLNTYLIYVIGGNYPRSHPVLAIPSLVTGGPLSAEDLQLVSELLGPAKPPTVTADEIARSDLPVFKTEGLAELEGTGKVHSSSTERCMVCLSDYEPEEDLRLLKCRHAFHRDCVDHWLTDGRNSCPTCRTEAVDKNSLAPAAAEPPQPAGVADAAA